MHILEKYVVSTLRKFSIIGQGFEGAVGSRQWRGLVVVVLIIVNKVVREILVSLDIPSEGDPLKIYKIWFYYQEVVCEPSEANNF